MQPAPGAVKVEQRAEALAEAGNLRALEVDLTIQRHKQMDGLQFRVAGCEEPFLVDEPVCQMLNGVAKNPERERCLRTDAAATLAAQRSCRRGS